MVDTQGIHTFFPVNMAFGHMSYSLRFLPFCSLVHLPCRWNRQIHQYHTSPYTKVHGYGFVYLFRYCTNY